jgi:hypothetical protein
VFQIRHSVSVSSSKLDPEEVTLRLTKAEALVLFEWLHRNEDRDKSKSADYYDIVDPAERTALWNLSCDLESALAEPFKSDYDQLVEAARAELRPQGEIS